MDMWEIGPDFRQVTLKLLNGAQARISVYPKEAGVLILAFLITKH